MAKDEFTDAFQTALTKEVDYLLNTEWYKDGFIVKKELSTVDTPGKFDGFIDIGIRDNDLPNVLVAIEIEHKSNRDQAMQNINKLKTWAHNSPNRKCGLLQIFNEECNPKENDICRLVNFANENQKKDKGFFYEYAFYIERRRNPETVANEVINSKNFRTRLSQLLTHVGSFENV